MTEPKRIPLTARLQAYAEHWGEELRHLLQVPDDARDVAFEEEPPLPTDAELAAEYDRARGYDRPLEVQAAEAREDIRACRAAKEASDG